MTFRRPDLASVVRTLHGIGAVAGPTLEQTCIGHAKGHKKREALSCEVFIHSGTRTAWCKGNTQATSLQKQLRFKKQRFKAVRESSRDTFVEDDVAFLVFVVVQHLLWRSLGAASVVVEVPNVVVLSQSDVMACLCQFANVDNNGLECVHRAAEHQDVLRDQNMIEEMHVLTLLSPAR